MFCGGKTHRHNVIPEKLNVGILRKAGFGFILGGSEESVNHLVSQGYFQMPFPRKVQEYQVKEPEPVV